MNWQRAITPLLAIGGGGEGEPYRVPDQDGDGYTIMRPLAALQVGKTPRPPIFDEIVRDPESFGPLFPEVEYVARRAILPQPKDRYRSVDELRQAVQLLQARLRMNRMNEIRDQIQSEEARMTGAWENFKWNEFPEEAHWNAMTEPLESLKTMRQSWLQQGENLVIYLTEGIRGGRWPEAQQMIAQISWDRLIEGGDRLDPITRGTLMERIRENDVPTEGVPEPTMARAINGRLGVEISGTEINDIARDISSEIQVRVLPQQLHPEMSGVYEEGAPELEGSWQSLRNQIRLRAGYYVFEVEVPSYARMRVPVQIGLEDVRNSLESRGEPFRLDLEFVPQELVPDDMVVIHRGEATTGHDFQHDGSVFMNHSFPKRTFNFPTFAISRDPVSVGQYYEFAQDSLDSGVPFNEVRNHIPATRASPQAIQAFARVRQAIGKAFRGTETHYWQWKSSGFGKNRRVTIIDPSTHLDPFGDPISLNQPISAISAHSAMAYAEWRSNRENVSYRLPSADEMEKVTRGSLPWTRPWGYRDFDRRFLLTRISFPDLSMASPQEIGTHPLGTSRDISLYGTRDNIGNVRFNTSSQAEDGSNITVGGSVGLHMGPYFSPSFRMPVSIHSVRDGMGAFRLVREFHPSVEEPSGENDGEG